MSVNAPYFHFVQIMLICAFFHCAVLSICEGVVGFFIERFVQKWTPQKRVPSWFCVTCTVVSFFLMFIQLRRKWHSKSILYFYKKGVADQRLRVPGGDF